MRQSSTGVRRHEYRYPHTEQRCDGRQRFSAVRLGFVVGKVGNPLFPDVTCVVDSILSLCVRIVQLVERLLVFHGMSLRRSRDRSSAWVVATAMSRDEVLRQWKRVRYRT
jgi:hypothetical protein